jgi:hypothetical protein
VDQNSGIDSSPDPVRMNDMERRLAARDGPSWSTAFVPPYSKLWGGGRGHGRLQELDGCGERQGHRASIDIGGRASAITGTSASPNSSTQLRAILFDTDNYYPVIQQVCDSIFLCGYRLIASHHDDDQGRLILLFQR